MEDLANLLERLQAYYDAVPRADASVDNVGPFTLFIKSGPGFPYYARPSSGVQRFSMPDVQRVRERQRELGVPETFEWVAETTPSLADVMRASGLAVLEHPLMVLAANVGNAEQVAVRLVTEADDLPVLNAIAYVGFGAPGTAIGPAGVDAARAAADRNPAAITTQRQRLRTGRTMTAVAFIDAQPVGIGSHQPVGQVTEIVGVAVLPAFRRRGIAASLTSFLVEDAQQRGIRTIFLSAGDEAVARIYSRVGFHRIGTACAAE